MDQAATYARMIKAPLIQALHNNVPGQRFAGVIIINYGEPAYQFLVQQGEQGVMRLLQAAPEVWGEVQRYGVRVPQFLSEFMDVQGAAEQAEQMRNGQQAKAQPRPTQPRPVVVTDPQAPPAPSQTGGRTIITPGGPVQAQRPNGVPPGVPGETA